MSIITDVRTILSRDRRLVRRRRDRLAVERALARRAAGAASGTADGSETADSPRAAVYFADARVNLYQIRQWYAPLAELARTLPVVVLSAHPSTARVLLDECPLPVWFTPNIAAVERRTAEAPLDVVFYVNQNSRNFSILRFRRPAHVFLSHGESDKDYMVSNQFKAYDQAFVAGSAARERLGRSLIGYDVDRRTREIGRPQVDVAYDGPSLPDDGRTTVLYAPTWEGDRPSMSYSSIASHGPRLVRSLLRSGDYRVVYRPHPRTGTHAEVARVADRVITGLLEAANKADPGARHLVDTDTPFGWHLRGLDVCVTDISAVAFDWLATGKPLVVTAPAAADARVDDGSIVHRVTSIDAAHAGEAPTMIDRLMTGLDGDERRALAEHYFGDITPGSALRRFIDAAHAVADERAAHFPSES